ncbi:MAG: DUF4114 domain-containing protein [Elainella sp.]
MKTTFLTGLFTVAVAAAGAFAQAAPAAAFSWDNTWTQSAIKSKAETGFDDAPFQKFVQAERLALTNSGLFLLDPSKLKLKYAHEVSAYFINEGAGYRNQLAYEATNGTTKQSGLIFNDISSAEAIGNWGGDALNLGDSVKLGNFAAGTQLDFWLRADGLNRGNGANIFGTQTSFNADRLQHVVAYAFDRYLMLGFEDLYGDLYASGQDPVTGRWNEWSDRDFNDAIFVVDIGKANVDALTSVPEPATTAALIGLGAAGLLNLRRRNKTAS